MPWVFFFLLLLEPLYADKIIGYITDESKKPIAKVNIELQNFRNPEDARYTTSNDNGFFVFAKLKPDNYSITTKKLGWLSWTSRKITIKTSEDRKKIFIALKAVPMSPLAFIHLCCLIVTMLSGYFVLFFNFFISPVPSKNVTWAGWAFIVIAISNVFAFQLALAITIALFGLPIPAMITWRGLCIRKEVIQQEREMQQSEKALLEQQNKLSFFVGQKGMAITDLKPCGTAHIVVEVKSQGFIPKKTPIVVTNFENGQLIVKAQ